jgi:hypothetical protein
MMVGISGELFEYLRGKSEVEFLKVLSDFLVAVRSVTPLQMGQIAAAVEDPDFPEVPCTVHDISDDPDDTLLEDIARVRA